MYFQCSKIYFNSIIVFIKALEIKLLIYWLSLCFPLLPHEQNMTIADWYFSINDVENIEHDTEGTICN